MVHQTIMPGVSVSLKTLRTRFGLSQRVLAGLIGVKQTTISKWELCKQKPTRAAVLRMAEIFNIDFADMDRTFI